GRLPHALEAPEVAEQLALAARADAGNVGQRGAQGQAAAAVAVEADAEAVSLVAELLEAEQLGAVVTDGNGVLGVGEKHTIGLGRTAGVARTLLARSGLRRLGRGLRRLGRGVRCLGRGLRRLGRSRRLRLGRPFGETLRERHLALLGQRDDRQLAAWAR